MKKFYCFGKKGFCDKIGKTRVCNDCEYIDGSGGEEREEKTKVHRDENGDVFCSSCGFPLHRQRSEGNYCSACGAALDWN